MERAIRSVNSGSCFRPVNRTVSVFASIVTIVSPLILKQFIRPDAFFSAIISFLYPSCTADGCNV